MVESSVVSQRHRAKQVDSRKRTIESRLAEILAELDGMPGAPGLYDSLVDSEVHIFFGDQNNLAQMQLKCAATCRAIRGQMWISCELDSCVKSTSVRSGTPAVPCTCS